MSNIISYVDEVEKDKFIEEALGLFKKYSGEEGWYGDIKNYANPELAKRHSDCFEKYMETIIDLVENEDYLLKSPEFYAKDYVYNMKVMTFEDIIKNNENLQFIDNYKAGFLSDLDLMIENFLDKEGVWDVDSQNKIVLFEG